MSVRKGVDSRPSTSENPGSQFDYGSEPLVSNFDKRWQDVGNPDHTNTKYELEKRVRGLKTELQGWKNRLEEQVATYKTELSTLKRELQQEVEVLKTELHELRVTVKGHLENTSSVRRYGEHARLESN